MKKSFVFIWLIAILGFNIYAMTQLNLTHENLSHFSLFGKHEILFIWGSLTSCWFYFISKKLFQSCSFKSKFASLALTISSLMMFLSVVIPYQPDKFYVLSELHIFLAFYGTICYAGVILWFHQHLRFYAYQVYQKAIFFYLLLVMFCLLQYITYGCVNTYMECSFSIGASLYLYFLHRAIQSSHNQ